ncbi:MAG: 5'-deoxynucleotidase [Bacillota bacterium]
MEEQPVSHFFAYLARMKLINRWGLMRNTLTENIQEHSLQVAMVAHGLAIIRNEFFGGQMDQDRVLALAVFHDAGEVITGDLATPIKYFNPEIHQAYQSIEKVAKEKLLRLLPSKLKNAYKRYFLIGEEDMESWQLVKAADKICAYLKCLEELKSGNEEFSKAKQVIEKELQENPLPEVNYFLKVFVPSFMLTIDELN